jgi:hypothetical protein
MGDTIGQAPTHVKEQYIRLGKKAKGKKLGARKAPKLIIGTVEEETPPAGKETTIKLKPTPTRGKGRIGATVGEGRPLGDRDAGVTGGMGGRRVRRTY